MTGFKFCKSKYSAKSKFEAQIAIRWTPYDGMFQCIYIAVFPPNTNRHIQTTTAAPDEFSANTVHLRWRVNIPETWGSHGCRDSSPPWLSLSVVSALMPQLLLSGFKLTVQHYRALFWKSFHTDTCQILQLVVQQVYHWCQHCCLFIHLRYFCF